jgi:hypothetical protein
MTLEDREKPGVHYAFTQDGIELPIVDVSHPAFALNVTTAEQKMLVRKFLKEGSPFRSLPKHLRNLLLRFFLRGSLLLKAFVARKAPSCQACTPIS